MNVLSNIEYLLGNSTLIMQKRDNQICELIQFTAEYSSFKLANFSHIHYSTSNKEAGEYTFNYKGNSYSFSLLSDRNIQKRDQNYLKDIEIREKRALLRTLKLSQNKDFSNVSVVVGKSKSEIFSILLTFTENDIEKVIDYEFNIVMPKKDYYNIFEFQELNTLTPLDVYIIFEITDKLGNNDLLFELLFFKEEICKSLSCLPEFKKYQNTYDEHGININNYAIFGNHFDTVFFDMLDMLSSKYETLWQKLKAFTENSKESNEITKKGKNSYLFKSDNFPEFEFGLISDIEPSLNDLLIYDESTYHCHINSLLTARYFMKKGAKPVIVSGKFKANDIDYLYHSLIVFPDKDIIFDVDHNLWMKREVYYKLREFIEINRTLVTDMYDYIIPVHDIISSTIQLNYFGDLIAKDLKRNKRLFLQ